MSGFKKNRPNVAMKVFVFGCRSPRKDAKRAENDLYLGNQEVYNTAMGIRRDSRDAYWALLAAKSPDFAELRTSIQGVNEQIAECYDRAGKVRVQFGTRQVEAPQLKEEIGAFKTHRDVLIKLSKELETELKSRLKAEIDEINRQRKTARKALKQRAQQEFGLSPQTVDKLLEECDKSANLRFRPFSEGKSKFFHRNSKSQRFPTWREVCDGKYSQLLIEPCPEELNHRKGSKNAVRRDQVKLAKFWAASGRGGKQARSDGYVELVTTLHREIPADAKVIAVALLWKRRGACKEWELHVTCEHESFEAKAPGSGIVSLDCNYRLRGDLAVMTWAGDDGRWGHITYPRALVDGFHSLDELSSHLDNTFNEARGHLVAWKHANESPAWLAEETRYCHQWRSPEKLARVVRKWERFAGDEAIFEELSTWLKEDFSHLQRTRNGRRRKLMANRNQFQHRVVAQFKRLGYGTVLLDGIGLKKLGTKPPLEMADHSLDNTRWCKNIAAHGYWKQAFQSSGMKCILPKSCAYTSRDCTGCDHRNAKPEPGEVDLVCAACGKIEHRDVRGALNPLQKHLDRRVALSEEVTLAEMKVSGPRKKCQERLRRRMLKYPGLGNFLAAHQARREGQRSRAVERDEQRACRNAPYREKARSRRQNGIALAASEQPLSLAA